MTDFDARYATGDTPWDLGRPQRAFVELEASGAIKGAVLDVGCGTGDLALYLAGRGHDVLGVDSTHRAIAGARDKARERGLEARAQFRVHDALALGALGRRWDTLVDSGLFHVFDDEGRARYVASLADAAAPGGALYVLCWSDAEPVTGTGPRRVSERELREAFASGWTVESIEPARFELTRAPGFAAAWLASVRRAAG